MCPGCIGGVLQTVCGVTRYGRTGLLHCGMLCGTMRGYESKGPVEAACKAGDVLDEHSEEIPGLGRILEQI